MSINAQGWVYFIVEAGPSPEFVKIGRAFQLDDRVRSLQIGNPRELYAVVALEMDDCIAAEHYLHGLYAPYHYRGEWFYIAGELAKFLSEYLTAPAVVPDYVADP